MIKFIKNLGWPKIVLFVFGAFLFSWAEKEDITFFLFSGKSFEGRAVLFQILLIGVYTLFFALLFFLLISLLEKLFVYWHRVDWPGIDARLPVYYKNVVVFSVIALLLVYPLKYMVGFLSFPYPLEYREAAVVSPAIALANGINLYSFENFPEHIYLYGILYPLTLSPFVNLGDHPILIARAYNVFFLVAFLSLSFWIFRKRNASATSALVGVLILLNSICYIWTINGARPDAPALFFSFLGFYFLLNRKFDDLGIFLCALSCVISFYFKQYLFFSALVVAVFLFLFVSKQKAYLFVAAVAALGLTSFIAIRSFFPLYYEYSILHHIVISATSINTSHMEEQTSTFLGYYWAIFLLYFFYLYKRALALDLSRLKKIRLSPIQPKEPFIRYASVELFDIGIIFAIVTLTFWLGNHGGNTYTYYGELLLPFLLYFTIPKIDELFKFDLHRVLIQVFILAFCVFPFRLNYEQDHSSWKESFALLSQYAAQCENIYDESPLAAVYKIENKISPVYNNGQIEYAETAIPDRTTIFGRLSKAPDEYLSQQLFKWNAGIENNIKNQEFDCIFSDDKQQIENYTEVMKIPSLLGWTIYVRVPLEP
ncbi:MAG: hypothetical protein RBS68_07635 [Anaerolineales bacterium]|jgi:hypothetical protein|nr:hypothetical protein [Anaerolineales bacterium]